MSAPFRPLAGIRVLDLSRLLPGPFLTQLFSDLGADVVKVEEPGIGDFARVIPPEVEGAGFAFTAVNRGKRSVAMDLKAPGAREAIFRLAARSDVLVESFRPGVMDRLGLGDEALESANPRLVRASLVGYPPGPLRDEPGHDINYVALAGILSIQGTRDAPVLSPLTVGDLAGAMYGATGVLAALYERERTGRGRRVEVALSDAALAFNAINLQRARAEGEVPERGAWELAGGMPGYRAYRCADGGWIALGALEPKFWDRFVAAVERPDLAGLHLDPAGFAPLEAIFATRSRDAWVERLAKEGVPVAPALEPHEALAHPAAAGRFDGRVGPASPLTGEPPRGTPPALGEHGEEALVEAGFTRDDIDALRRSGALR